MFTLSCSTTRVNASMAAHRTQKTQRSSQMVLKSNKKQSSFALKSAKTDEIIESMKTLTLMEASELVKQIEETFGVDASAPAGGGMMMMAGPAEAGEAAAVQTEFDLIITEVAADKRIACIKVVRTLTDLGLKEAKDAVTNLPFTLMAAKKKEDCQAAQKTLEEAGAKSEIK